MPSVSRVLEVLGHVLKPVFSLPMILCFVFALTVECHAQNDPVEFKIPSLKLQAALDAFVEATGVSLIYNNLDFGDATSTAVEGRYAPEKALNLILEGTGLTFEFTSEDTVAIKKKSPQPQPEEFKKKVDESLPQASRLSTTKDDEKTAQQVNPSNVTAENELKETQEDVFMLEEMIVTGVFDERKKIESTISITTIEANDIARRAPVSSADLLKDIPGVFVNSSLGEIRNVVYSRGVSANSIEASQGYYYVSMQEDSLPVTNVTFVNYGPDYYLRPDATLTRLEAVRGGTAAIATSNAPGGIYNYLSKTGGIVFEGLVSTKLGFEGDGENPYKRGDFNIGGPLSNDFYFNTGGFYRDSVGGRDAGYDLNYGGQLKANVTKEYDSGEAKFYLKLLDDHNAWFEFNYARNFDDPTLVSGLGGRNGSTLIAQTATTAWDGTEYDPTDLVHSKDTAVGLDWNHDVDDSLCIKNSLKYSGKSSDWNTSAAITAHQLDDFMTAVITGAVFTKTPAGSPAFGTFEFYDRPTGETVASVFIPPPPVGDPAMISNDGLTNQDVLENGVMTQFGNLEMYEVDEWMDQFTAVKKLENMTLSGGLYYAHAEVYHMLRLAGIGFSYFDDQPRMFGARVTDMFTGTTYQITNPEGYGPASLFARSYDKATQDNLALFFGHDWNFRKDWNLDWGLRWERVNVEGINEVWQTVWDDGGADGDPLTLYDVRDEYNPDGVYRYDESLDTFAFSLAFNYRLNDQNSVYVRYSDSKKAPDLGFFFDIDNMTELNELNPKPQRLRQYEATWKCYSGDFYLLATPFYSHLSNVTESSLFTDEDGSNTYTPPRLYNEIETVGIEFEGEYRFTDTFSIRGTAVWQKAEAAKWKNWVANGNGSADDTILDFSGNDADNNPDLMFTIETKYQSGPLYASLACRYMGERPANVPNTFTLPSFSYVDFSGSFTLRDKWKLQLNVNNVLNSDGVMSWQAPGGFPTALERQAFTPEVLAANPEALFGVVQIPQRAFFLTLSCSF